MSKCFVTKQKPGAGFEGAMSITGLKQVRMKLFDSKAEAIDERLRRSECYLNCVLTVSADEQSMWRTTPTLGRASGAHRSLNKKVPNTASVESPKTFAAPQTSALLPRSVQSSITEGTTELLFPKVEKRERVPVERKAVDTAEVG